MDIHHGPTPSRRLNRLQYGNLRWTPDQEADYLRWRQSIPFTNLDIAVGYIKLARTVSDNLALAYRTKAGQIKNGRRFGRNDYKLVLPFLGSRSTFRSQLATAKPLSEKDVADYQKVAPSKIPAEQLRPTGFRKVVR